MAQEIFPHRSFVEATGIENYQVAEKYYSKKNNVFRVVCNGRENESEKQVVVKHFLQSQKHFQREVMILEHLHLQGIPVPSLYRYTDRLLIMEHLPGSTLLQLLEKAEQEDDLRDFERYRVKKHLVYGLLNWLHQTYAHLRDLYGQPMILCDIHFRNFIVGRHLYGFDFENCRPGFIEEDLAAVMVYLLHYDPAWTLWKRELATLFRLEAMRLFPLDPERLKHCFESKVNELHCRRYRQDHHLELG
ncbi:MAG: RIO1 family regulatory kinase/ATPase [Bacillota bacterium]|nr:RIO1 family regulatory kinase/ATPase [Bacillota bacterium]MDW7676990.1 RIO1 family regulatory kinase/ATPase [Bacillota bacterium]